ncbi:hypothetical protein BG004_008403 [Podila humilis]|nr:hypothetical protein BG004_008403 [Podila humilis]
MHGITPRSMLGLACIISLAMALPQPAPAQPLKRAIKYVTDSEALTEITYMTNDDYYRDAMPLNTCFTNFSRPVNTRYLAITAPDHQVAINYYGDTECAEFEFSILSEYTDYAGEFGSAKYVGQFLDAKPGMYESREFSPNDMPDQDPDGENHKDSGIKPKIPPTQQQPQQGGEPTAQGSGSNSGTSSVGFIIGVGLVGLLTIAGVVASGVWLYRRHSNGGGRGDKRFMTLATGRDDYDDEVGLTGENGPHSSALMQSRVGVSFDDERFPGKYHDEEQAASDEESENRVELGAYPQNPAGPKQYRPEPGTLPQNQKDPAGQ